MADINLIDTTFGATNITAGFSVYEYIVPGSGLVYKMRFQVRLVGVAGGGDYVINLRLNDGDVQTDDPMVPKTTYTAGAGVQNFWFPSISIDGMSGDAINIWIVGQPGDNAVTGSIRIFADDAVGVTTYGNKLDVSATGEAGIDWANIGNPTTAVALTQTSILTATAIATILSGITSLASWLKGLARKDAMNAVAKAELNLGGGGYDETTDSLEAERDNIGTAGAGLTANVDQTWDELLAGHAVVGSAGAALTTAGAATDPLLNPVPGAYPAGTAGYALGRVGSGVIATTSIVTQDGDVETYQGDDYDAADGRSIDWTNVLGTWPDLTGAVITVALEGLGNFIGSVITPSGAGQKVRLELTKAQTLTIPVGDTEFEVRATVGGDTFTLVHATWTSIKRY